MNVLKKKNLIRIMREYKGKNMKEKKEGILYWITGLPGSGKTIIGNKLYYTLKETQDNVVILDGNILKGMFNENVEYSLKSRRERAIRYAKLCKLLTEQGLVVICCTVSMFDEVREWNRRNNKGYVEIFLDVPMEVLEERNPKGLYSKSKEGDISEVTGVDIEVELPQKPDIIIHNDGQMSIRECVQKIMSFDIHYSSDYDRDTEYWNLFYASKTNVQEPSLFAREVIKQMKPSAHIIELGCGNGRDSLFFAENGMNVVAIDASDRAIEDLNNEHGHKDNIMFICDDFCCSKALFVGEFDYCYSRFTIHSITESQETELLKNIYGSLKEGGMLFIEVRSINDDIYGCGEKIARNTYRYNGHFRRFVVKSELEEKIRQIGYDIVYSEEKRDFAPYGDSNPPIIRVFARK